MLSATCLLNESRLDLIPILYFDRGYNLEYNMQMHMHMHMDIKGM